METKFEATVRLRKGNKVFKQPMGSITSAKLLPFAGKKVSLTVKITQ